jgi:protein TonB
MESKKSRKADLQNKKLLFREIGFILAFGLVFIAFEWTSVPKELEGFSQEEQSDVVQENVPVTRQKTRKEPPPPPPPQSTEVLNIVENDVAIDDELILEQTGADQDTRVQIDAFTQEEESEDEEEKIFVIVEDMPDFKGGGLKAFTRYVQEHVEYPIVAQENGIEGTVFVRFVVDKDGSIIMVETMRGVDPVLDKAAIAAVSDAPKWDPGKQRGKPVKVCCTIPIVFMLN